MSSEYSGAAAPPHILIFPVPLQGHVSSMLNLAEIFCLSDLHVTVVLTDYSHRRLLRHGGLHSRFSRYGGAFRAATISDGLPDDHPRTGEAIFDVVMSLREVGGEQFRRVMESSDGASRRRVSCLIIDGMMSYTLPVAAERRIPYFIFRTISACAFWSYFCTPEIIAAGEMPLRGNDEDKLTYWRKKEMDFPVTAVPGMEGILRRRDLPGLLRVNDAANLSLQAMAAETKATTKANGFILNTFEDLEGPILDQIRKHIPNLYSVGPLHSHLKSRLESSGFESSQKNSSSFWAEDSSCIDWLDSQPIGSVVYVSFGSVTMLTRDELFEFWYGLVNSGIRFLWVIRPDSVVGNRVGDTIPEELEEGTKRRGHMVEWVPQSTVLGHPSVGVFFTHSGWNSILECVAIGLPMICWAYFVDQMTNSRFVSEVWKMGLDIKDTCDRVIVENVVREVMEVRKDEFLERARAMSIMARNAISEGGSSFVNLNRLNEFLKSTTQR
ncbi:7-deoxyloganetic acid glucosyl transferase-like [Andrographis paniculata]|uniref:7-deoxyloganetic acid glucosyl transferase-like n=1 Tax=Andrographis paniculata TaxID=175694 RepID=UPI0021E98481|nr:7-deoxyloganetic acid glucosyl transferase-like [Andrographis paniculata]